MIQVSESTDAAAARREATRLAAQIGFDAHVVATIALVASELASNLYKHGGGGEFHVYPLQGAQQGLDLIVLDKGPGIGDVAQAFEDGYSTAGSPGTGLGAVARLAHFYDVYSAPGKGTALLIRFYRNGGSGAGSPLTIGGVRVPRTGEVDCGDNWAALQTSGRLQVAVCDGLGHGPNAAAAADAAISSFSRTAGEAPEAILKAMHQALRSTRGAAAALLDLDYEAGKARYAGVGNISGSIIDRGGTVRHMVSHNGTIGHVTYRIQEFNYEFGAGAMAVLHSDGVATHWGFDSHPGLSSRHPSLIAGVLYRDFNRGRDDATVIVVKQAEGKVA